MLYVGPILRIRTKFAMIRRSALSLLLLATALLAACASHPPAPTVPRTSAGETPGPGPVPGRGLYKVGNPYQIAGVWYSPQEDFSYDETGIASWYGEEFHGRYTANGEIFDLNTLTAAHRTLPMPCIVQVINLENGRSISLRVNDRGPYARGRIIDVSRRAAQLLGFEGQGTAKVRVKILVPESLEVATLAGRNGGVPVAKAGDDVPQAAPREPVLAEALASPPAVQVASTEPGNITPAPATPRPLIAPAPVLSEKVTVVPVGATQIYIQVGAYAVAANALHVKDRLQSIGPVKVYGARINGVDLYRVRLGPIANVDQADQILGRVVDAGLTEARIVVD
jgi:rare lipoprotein A